uniref:Uncharacterized protein n=1 Tax=Arundo donax TaxID=35708 RepID=A0A0A9BPE9_ARUDO
MLRTYTKCVYKLNTIVRLHTTQNNIFFVIGGRIRLSGPIRNSIFFFVAFMYLLSCTLKLKHKFVLKFNVLISIA